MSMISYDGFPAGTGAFDLASPADHLRVRELADTILHARTSTEVLRALGSDANAPLDLRLAGKLALSKMALRDVQWEGRMAIVFAMWGERRRLRPRSDENPTGEDALHVKLDQLTWLFADSAIDWRVYPVDDGDPEGSADIAEERAALHPEGHRVKVLRLADAIPTASGPLSTLTSTDASRKGGAIVHGADVARSDGCELVVMTDADNSVNLGQIGLLLSEFDRGSLVVIGDRKHPEAVLVKAEARWGPGIVVLRHMQRAVGRALFGRGIRDTQAAFKLYSGPVLDDILAAPSTFGFAFDSDWLYAALAGDHTIERVPMAFIDSFEESASITQGPMTTWESLLRGLVAAARARGVDHDEAMARVVDDHADSATLEQLVQLVPDQLANVSDADLGDVTVMSPADLRTWIEGVTQ